MLKFRLLSALILASLIFAACAPAAPQAGEGTLPSQATEVPEMSGAKGEMENSSESQTLQPGGKFPAPVLQARQALAAQLSVAPNTIKIQNAEPAQWPDSCLGLPRPDEMCAEVITQGFGGTLLAGEEQWEFRVDASGEMARFIPEAASEARQMLGQQVKIGARGLTAEAIHIVSVEQVDWPDACLGIARQDIMCAQVITPGYRILLEFEGKRYEYHTDAAGGVVILAEELSSLESELALTWHREGGFAGFCNDLSIYLSGEVYASSCGGNQPEEVGRTRLSAERLEQVQAWVDALGHFEVKQKDPAVADAMTISLDFSGAGTRQPTGAEKDAILNFASTIYAEMEMLSQESAAPSEATRRPAGDMETARQVLVDYFAALNSKDWDRIVDMYGGSYETLQYLNPSIKPDDYSALFESGCSYNGLMCDLQLGRFLKEEQVSSEEFKFTIEFLNKDGSTFILGPCCGGNATDQPPLSEFTFTVKRAGNQFLVQDLPVYVP